MNSENIKKLEEKLDKVLEDKLVPITQKAYFEANKLIRYCNKKTEKVVRNQIKQIKQTTKDIPSGYEYEITAMYQAILEVLIMNEDKTITLSKKDKELLADTFLDLREAIQECTIIRETVLELYINTLHSDTF
jgi:hypothetical protein